MATSAHAQPSKNESDAAALLEQGRALASEQPDVALGLYRAAIHLTPKDPTPHLLAAELLLKKSGCKEATPELRTWLSLVEQPPADPEEYTRVVMLLSDCLKQNAADVPSEPAAKPSAAVAPTQAPLVPTADVEKEDMPLPNFPDELPDEFPDELPPLPPPAADSEEEAESEAEAESEPETQAEPEPELKPTSLEPRIPKTELEIVIAQPGWTCRLGDYVCRPDADGNILVELGPGDYTLDCNHPTSAPLSQPLSIPEGQRVRVSIGASSNPRGATTASQESQAPSVEPMFGLGMGPAFGRLGVAGGVRFDHFSVLAGTGVEPLAISGSWHLNSGETGFYLTGGWMLLGNSLLRTASVAPMGQGVFGGGGVEVRFQDTFLVRLGVGLQYDTTETTPGPLTFDLSAFWLP